jgi:hypothetical protein
MRRGMRSPDVFVIQLSCIVEPNLGPNCSVSWILEKSMLPVFNMLGLAAAHVIF